MNTQKHFSWRLSLVAALVILTQLMMACSGQPPTAPTSVPAQPPTAPAEKVKLRMYMQQDALLVPAMQALLDSFQAANPNITVQLESFPFAEYHSKLSTAFAGNDAPDVFWMDIRLAEFASQGTILPLDSYITQQNKDDYIASAWTETKYEGKTYGVPLHQLTEALFVNTKMATDAGITLPKTVNDAWTWTQFVENAKKLTQRSGTQTSVWGFGIQRPLQDWSIHPVIFQHNGKTLSDDLKTASGFLNSKETVEALTWYGKLFTTEKIVSVEAIPDGFFTGKIAIWQAPSTQRPVLDSRYPDLKYTVVPLFKDVKCSVMTGGWNASINAKTKYTKESWALVDWITRTKHKEWVDKSGYLPARKSVIDVDAKYKEYPWSVFMEQLQNCGATRPPTPKYSFYFDTFKQAVTDIATGQEVQKTLDAAAKKLDAELGKK